MDGVPLCRDCNDSNANIKLGIEYLCDGADNDCDSSVDEDFFVQHTDCGLGSCRVSVSTSCTNGVFSGPSCVPGMPWPEICDTSIDEDCDGETDELSDCSPSGPPLGPICAGDPFCPSN